MLTAELGSHLLPALQVREPCRLSVLGLSVAVSGAKGQVDGVTSPGSHSLPCKLQDFQVKILPLCAFVLPTA